MAIAVFLAFVTAVLAVSTYTSRKAAGMGGYFVANNSVHWGVNGIAFAGGYLSVASFLGIAGLIAFFGYDGFLYSIGFLAGWIVALFVIAEPMKRMGTFTFSDALNRNFGRPGIQIAAGVSVLVVSLFYLVPQMVGAGVLVEPLLGIPHYFGVIIVGSVVIIIVAGGGMTSTTYVQFFNGGLLLTFALVLTVVVLGRGINTTGVSSEEGVAGLDHYSYEQITVPWDGREPQPDAGWGTIVGRHAVLDPHSGAETVVLYRVRRTIPAVADGHGGYGAQIKGRIVRLDPDVMQPTGWEIVPGAQPHVRIEDWWRLATTESGTATLVEVQSRTNHPNGAVVLNGAPEGPTNRLRQMGGVSAIPDEYGTRTGPIGPIGFLRVFADPATTVERPRVVTFTGTDGERTTIHYAQTTAGERFMRPGLLFPLEAGADEPRVTTLLNRLNFISLMLALFLGTAALPHILIRYYTVPSAEAARKSTIVAIIGIGLFYILTMYLGLGAVAAGALNPESNNMSAPLLARSFGEVLFAMISGIAFTTVLATVSGLIMAASGAVAHDLMTNILRREFSDQSKVRAARIVAVVVGVIGIVLGIAFRDMNVSFLVGWAFAVAASANLPSLVFMLFWKKTTAYGIIASISVGVGSSVALILLSPDMWARYGFDPARAPMPINQPGIVSIPLSFLVLILVSLATQQRETQARSASAQS